MSLANGPRGVCELKATRITRSLSFLFFQSHLPTQRIPPQVPGSTKNALGLFTEEFNKYIPWALGLTGAAATCNISVKTSVLGVSPMEKTKHDAGEDQGQEPRSGPQPQRAEEPG